ncbi:MAG TPA: type II secretion system protein N [Steroidobacteraceae bacterium]|nr:type II secretion system protein N [Steroidobacteraceae bacterium]
MRKALPLIAAGVAAFLVTLLAIAPASLVTTILPSGVTLGMTSGTLWSGTAESLTVQGQSLGGIRWKFLPLHLFRGRVAFDGELLRGDGQVRGRLALGLGGRYEARNLEIHLPLASLPPGIAPRGWLGVVRAQLPSVQIPPAPAVPKMLGTIELRGLQAPPPNGAPIGSYSVAFDAASAQADKLVGQLKDLEGPMQVTGTVTLSAQRNYVIEGLIAPRAGASQAVINTLRFLGPPDAQGRRPFSLAGTY